MQSRRDTTSGSEPAYRAYQIGEDNRVVASIVIEAASDEAALRQVEAVADGHPMELWDRDRLVARVARTADQR